MGAVKSAADGIVAVQAAAMVGVNATGGAMAYHDSGVLAYAAGHSVAVMDMADGSIRTLKGHTAKVTVVHWMGSYLLSGGMDSTVRIWKDGESLKILSDHQSSVNCVAAIEHEDGYLIVSGSADGTIHTYYFTHVVKLVQTLSPEPIVPLSLSLINVSCTPLLAVAGSSKNINIYTWSDQFALSAVLPGHEDWVRCVDFCQLPGQSILLASASQDRYVRLWKVAQEEASEQGEGIVDRVLLSNKRYPIHINGKAYHATYEALLVGHDDWVTSCQWHPSRLCLLTSSADTSLMIWKPDPSSGMWICETALGEVGDRGATTATGSPGGFWQAAWQRDGRGIICNGRGGAIRMWILKSDRDGNQWQQVPGITGHTKEVSSLAWHPSGKYLLSTSLDQTTRLWAEHQDTGQWREFSRPQIHGYDLNAICWINDSSFASGAEEKVARVFELPSGVAAMLSRQCGVEHKEDLPLGATVPLMGLSNKSVSKDEGSTLRELDALTHPPFEEHLQRHSLWPEVEKLYGHGYEVSAVAASHDGRWLATACRATTAEYGVIRVYDTQTWREGMRPLKAHSLTVQRLSFSPDDQYLVSVGRDRQCAVFQREKDAFVLQTQFAKAHARIVWDVCWLPGCRGFATASRDKSIKIWFLKDGEWTLMSTLRFEVSVTAIDVCQCDQGMVLAAGLEEGDVWLHTSRDGCQWTAVGRLQNQMELWASITRLAWQPSAGQWLAVASADASIHLYEGLQKQAWESMKHS